MKYPTTHLIQDTNFNNSWIRAIRYILRDGYSMTIGDNENPKGIRDACVIFELTGNAITQIEDREIHPQFPFQHIDQYCQEFTREYQKEYENRNKDEKFTYTYFDRFLNYFHIDQLKLMKDNLKDQIKTNIASNRNQIITWDPPHDINHNSAPCLQNIWIRYLGNSKVEVHLHFRSHDLFSAWQANIIALIDMLNREVIQPNNCKIIKIVEYNYSLHIYKSDIDEAEKVKQLSINPQINYK